MTEEIRKFIADAKNICLIPSEKEPESLTAALALFYTLRELNKNVNLIVDEFPEKLNFLIPSLDFISSPKNFVISIPKAVADISQVYYEKTEENLKIHLTSDKGQIKKENISFYFQELKPDLVITLGIQDFKKYLENKLDSYGFLLGSPILNIDTSTPLSASNQENTKFGQINLIEPTSLSQIVLSLITSIDESLVKKNTAQCLLAGLVMYYENFKSKATSPEVFETAAELVKKGADYQEIIENLRKTTEKEFMFLAEILKNSKTQDQMSVAVLDSKEFENFDQLEASSAIDTIKTIGFKNDLLVLWQSHASDPLVKGFLYSKKQDLLHKISKDNQKDWIFLSMPESDIQTAKEKILKSIE